MGQIAEDALSGFTCSGCGIFFIKEHGFPVLCTACTQEIPKKDRLYPQATLKEFGNATETEKKAAGWTDAPD